MVESKMGDTLPKKKPPEKQLRWCILVKLTFQWQWCTLVPTDDLGGARAWARQVLHLRRGPVALHTPGCLPPRGLRLSTSALGGGVDEGKGDPTCTSHTTTPPRRDTLPKKKPSETQLRWCTLVKLKFQGQWCAVPRYIPLSCAYIGYLAAFGKEAFGLLRRHGGRHQCRDEGQRYFTSCHR